MTFFGDFKEIIIAYYAELCKIDRSGRLNSNFDFFEFRNRTLGKFRNFYWKTVTGYLTVTGKIQQGRVNRQQSLMSQYFMKAEQLENNNKLKDGDKLYQPDTLTFHRNAWQRCLDEEGILMNIKTDKAFDRSRTVLGSREKN